MTAIFNFFLLRTSEKIKANGPELKSCMQFPGFVRKVWYNTS